MTLVSCGKRGLRRTRLALLILAISLTVVATPALAAQLRYSMLASKRNGNATISVRDAVPIHVRVIRSEIVGNQGGNPEDVPGTAIRASVSNPSIGTLSAMMLNTGLHASDQGGADFEFTAAKPGRTVISFAGTISHIWWLSGSVILPKRGMVDRRDFVSAEVEITVEKCD